MSNTVIPGGPTDLVNLTATTTGPGSWFRIHPGVGEVVFGLTLTGTSAGVTVASTVNIQFSHDGSNVSTSFNLALTGVTPQVVAAGLASSQRGYPWVRANVNTVSSTTDTGTAFRLRVTANSNQRTL